MWGLRCLTSNCYLTNVTAYHTSDFIHHVLRFTFYVLVSFRRNNLIEVLDGFGAGAGVAGGGPGRVGEAPAGAEFLRIVRPDDGEQRDLIVGAVELRGRLSHQPACDAEQADPRPEQRAEER